MDSWHTNPYPLGADNAPKHVDRADRHQAAAAVLSGYYNPQFYTDEADVVDAQGVFVCQCRDEVVARAVALALTELPWEALAGGNGDE